jgi:hypothetical protein
LIQYKKGVELLFQEESRSASFVAIVEPSLNRVDPEFYELSYWILLVEQSAQISFMIFIISVAVLNVIRLSKACKAKWLKYLT